MKEIVERYIFSLLNDDNISINKKINTILSLYYKVMGDNDVLPSKIILKEKIYQYYGYDEIGTRFSGLDYIIDYITNNINEKENNKILSKYI